MVEAVGRGPLSCRRLQADLPARQLIYVKVINGFFEPMDELFLARLTKGKPIQSQAFLEVVIPFGFA